MMQCRHMFGNNSDYYDEEADYDNDDDDDEQEDDQHDELPTSVKTVHHSLISADGLVGIPHLGDGDRP